MHPFYQFQGGKPIERSSFATVWLARDVALDREVAIKELWNWAARPPRARMCFQFAHVRRLSLHHPGLAQVYGEDPDRGWIALEYFPEGSLARRLAQEGEPFPLETVRPLLVRLLETLAYLHDKGFVHAALRPSNLFLPPSGSIVLADGVGLRTGGECRPNHFLEVPPFEVKYLAPECLEEKAHRVGPATDLYALGMTTMELLLGSSWFEQLFPRVQASAQSWAHWQQSSETLPPLGDLLPEAAPELARVIEGLLRKDPQERLTASGALALLAPPALQLDPAPPRRGAASQPRSPARETPAPAPVPPPSGPVPAPSPVATPAPPARRRKPVFALATCLFGAGLGAGVTWYVRPAAAPNPLPIVGQASAEEIRTTKDERDRERVRVNNLTRELLATRDVVVAARKDAEASRSRADTLEARLTTSQGELTSAQKQLLAERARLTRVTTEQSKSSQVAETVLVRERAEGEKTRTRAEHLEGELKAAHAGLAQARQDGATWKERVESLESQLKGVRDQLLRQDSLQQDQWRRVAVAALRRRQGKVERDAQAPGKPVLKVDLSAVEVDDNDLTLLEILTSMQGLSLSSPSIGDQGMTHLKGLTNLRTLYLFKTRVGDPGLGHLAGLVNLRTLSLSGTQISDEGLARLRSMAQLQTLDLSHTRVTDSGLAHLSRLANLETLTLACPNITDAGLPHLKKLAKLHTVDLSFTRVTNNGVALLRDFPNLATVFLSTTQITDAGLAHFEGSSRLNTLDLCFTRVTDKGLVHLTKCGNLETLSLSTTQIGDEGLTHLKKLARLRTLDLSFTKISDAGLSNLGGLLTLETLSLSTTQIGDAGLKQLERLANLKDLYLNNTRVTAAGVAELRKMLPRCVIHPDPDSETDTK